jgi:hypothetical protein
VKPSLQRMVRHRVWLTIVSISVMATLGGVAVAFLYPRGPVVEVRYDRTTNESLLFQAENPGSSPIALVIEKFVVSTLKLGKIGFDQFEIQFAKNGAIVAGNAATGISVPVPKGAQPYLCSQLRSIGFFRDYGEVRDGKLPGRSSPERAQQIARDLRCSFTISEAVAAAGHPAEYTAGLACDRVAWIRDCVAGVLSSSN